MSEESVTAAGGAIAAPLRKPSLGTKLANGFGSVAFGVKNNGFD